MKGDPAVATEVRRPKWMQMADALTEVRRRITELFPGGIAGAHVSKKDNETLIIEFTRGFTDDRQQLVIDDLRDCGFELASAS